VKHQPVLVIWKDAHSIAEADWADLESVIDKDPYLVQTVGFLIEEHRGKPGHVTVFQSYTPDGDVDGILCIPREMVQSLAFVGVLAKAVGSQ
jgi:hypothetical protein